MDAAQSPGFVEVGVGTLEPFTALPQQALPHRLAVQTQLASNRSNRMRPHPTVDGSLPTGPVRPSRPPRASPAQGRSSSTSCPSPQQAGWGFLVTTTEDYWVTGDSVAGAGMAVGSDQPARRPGGAVHRQSPRPAGGTTPVPDERRTSSTRRTPAFASTRGASAAGVTEMAVRWAATTLCETEKNLRRVTFYAAADLVQFSPTSPRVTHENAGLRLKPRQYRLPSKPAQVTSDVEAQAPA